jgi:hypothetical protein
MCIKQNRLMWVLTISSVQLRNIKSIYKMLKGISSQQSSTVETRD